MPVLTFRLKDAERVVFFVKKKKGKTKTAVIKFFFLIKSNQIKMPRPTHSFSARRRATGASFPHCLKKGDIYKQPENPSTGPVGRKVCYVLMATNF